MQTPPEISLDSIPSCDDAGRIEKEITCTCGCPIKREWWDIITVPIHTTLRVQVFYHKKSSAQPSVVETDSCPACDFPHPLINFIVGGWNATPFDTTLGAIDALKAGTAVESYCLLHKRLIMRVNPSS